MSNISKTYGLALGACFALALAAAGNSFAQEQSDQNQREQSDQQPSDQSPQQSEQQSQQEQQERQRPEQERQQQQAQQQREQQREEQVRQRQQQARQRDEQWRNRDQSSWRDSDTSRDGQWPQPDGQEYGSDSLRYRSGEQFSRDDQRSDRSQQGGLGVSLRSDGREGVIVTQIHSGSPAEEMGIRQGDRLTAVNGREIQSVQQFIARIRNMAPGEQIELDIRRARGGEQTVRGELETRDEALADSDRQSRSYSYSYNSNLPGRQWSWESGEPGRDNQQTRYEEERGRYSQNRPSQTSRDRLDQIESQVDRLSRELDDLRVALQSLRRQSGQPTEWNRERTARYDEYYQGTGGLRRDGERIDDRGTFRPAEREREFEREGTSFDRDEPRDRFDDGPGGEIGSDRQSVGSENLQDRD
jgi:hypothetical protein